MKVLRSTIMVVAFAIAATLAQTNDPLLAAEGDSVEDELPSDEDGARPEWADPNANEPVGGVDEDPTPFNLGDDPVDEEGNNLDPLGPD